MDLRTLANSTGIPEEAGRRVEAFLSSGAMEALRDSVSGLTGPDAAAAYGTLKDLLGGDDMAMLACQLEAAVLAYGGYQAKGISDRVYFDTMGCFSRFLKETWRRTGKWCYDRGFWSYRQTSMVLFRIGELEYELRRDKEEIAIHIPSDARMAGENVDRSLALARKFMGEFYPECASYPCTCHSWLLSPELKAMLGEGSNILAFQRRFRIESVQPEEREFLQWLFEAEIDTPAENLREDTSLQKKAKALLLRGGNIGAARGILI